MKTPIVWSLAGCLAAAPALVLAEAEQPSSSVRPYIQVGAGGSVGSGADFVLIKFAGGMPLTQTVGVEAGYTSIGNIFFADVDIYYLSAVARFPTGARSAFAAKLGIAAWKTELEPFSLQTGEDSGTNAMVGLDWEYNTGKHLGLVVSLEQYGSVNVGVSGGDQKTGSISLGLRFRF